MSCCSLIVSVSILRCWSFVFIGAFWTWDYDCWKHTSAREAGDSLHLTDDTAQSDHTQGCTASLLLLSLATEWNQQRTRPGLFSLHGFDALFLLLLIMQSVLSPSDLLHTCLPFWLWHLLCTSTALNFQAHLQTGSNTHQLSCRTRWRVERHVPKNYMRLEKVFWEANP